MWSPSKHGGNNGAGTCRHGGIMPMHRCGGSHNFLKLQKEAATKALRRFRSWGVSMPLGVETYQNVDYLFNMLCRHLKEEMYF